MTHSKKIKIKKLLVHVFVQLSDNKVAVVNVCILAHPVSSPLKTWLRDDADQRLRRWKKSKRVLFSSIPKWW